MRPSPLLGTLNLRAEEVVPSLWAAAYFFFVLCSYSMLRPVREAIGLSGGVDVLSNLFLVTLAVTLVCNPLLSALMSRFPRRRFIPLSYRFFSLSLVAFFVLLQFFHELVGVGSGRVFFVWLTVYNLFAVTLFWAFMVDVFTLEQGKRLFALIGVGGTLGAVCGAAITQGLARRIEPAYLMLLAAVGLEAAMFCFRALARRTIDIPASDPGEAPAAPPAAAGSFVRQPRGDVPGGVFSGLWDAVRSPYLLGACAYVAMIGVGATFLYFAQARIISAAAPDVATRTAAFARIDFWSQCATLLLQVLVTARIIRRLGVGWTLVLLPLITGGAMYALGADPTLQTLIVAQVLSRAGQHALARPARETLFTVVSRGQKYRAKSVIDTFVFRAGDVIGTWADREAARGGIGLTTLAVPIALVWGAVGLTLGIGQNRIASRVTRASSS